MHEQKKNMCIHIYLTGFMCSALYRCGYDGGTSQTNGFFKNISEKLTSFFNKIYGGSRQRYGRGMGWQE